MPFEGVGFVCRELPARTVQREIAGQLNIILADYDEFATCHWPHWQRWRSMAPRFAADAVKDRKILFNN